MYPTYMGELLWGKRHIFLAVTFVWEVFVLNDIEPAEPEFTWDFCQNLEREIVPKISTIFAEEIAKNGRGNLINDFVDDETHSPAGTAL